MVRLSYRADEQCERSMHLKIRYKKWPLWSASVIYGYFGQFWFNFPVTKISRNAIYRNFHSCAFVTTISFVLKFNSSLLEVNWRFIILPVFRYTLPVLKIYNSRYVHYMCTTIIYFFCFSWSFFIFLKLVWSFFVFLKLFPENFLISLLFTFIKFTSRHFHKGNINSKLFPNCKIYNLEYNTPKDILHFVYARRRNKQINYKAINSSCAVERKRNVLSWDFAQSVFRVYTRIVW